MRKTIWNFGCAILALLSTSSVCAQITDPAELYGTYEFTADVEITEDGQPYADRFASKCEVTIEASEYRDLNIIGLAGGTDIQTANLKNGNLEIFDYNGNSYYLWGEPVLYGNENGESPWGGNQWTIIYTVDPATKNITVADFTAITVNKSWSADKVLAKFTNCKLTFKEAAVIKADDVSGDYRFKGNGTMDGSTFPTEFDVTLTAKDESNRTYDAIFNFGEGFKTLELAASFDGTRLNILFENAYLNDSQTLALCDFQRPGMLTGNITFTIGASGTAFSLTSGMSISRAIKEGEEVKYAYEQYYMGGGMSKPTADADNFAGTYHVKAGTFYNLVTMGGEADPYGYNYPEEFDITIEKDETDGQYYVTEFISPDVYSLNYGGIGCTVEGNTLKIPVGKFIDRIYMSDDYMTMVYHVLYNGQGENTGTVDLTVNEDGTCTLGNFFLFRQTMTFDANWNSESKYTEAAYYGDLAVTQDKPEVVTYDFDGTFHVKSDYIYNVITSGGNTDPYNYDYPSEFDITIEKDEMDGQYYVTEFISPDVYSLNYGGIGCTVEGNTLKIPVGKFIDRIYMSDDYMTMVYHVLYNGQGENTGTVDLTVNEDGTCTLGNFFLFRQTMTFDANWNSESVYTRAAYYSELTVTKGEGSGTGIGDAETIAAPQVYTAGGTIYVSGEPASVKVYNTAGALVFSGVASTVTGLNKGMYIVKTATASVKVVL